MVFSIGLNPFFLSGPARRLDRDLAVHLDTWSKEKCIHSVDLHLQCIAKEDIIQCPCNSSFGGGWGMLYNLIKWFASVGICLFEILLYVINIRFTAPTCLLP